MGAEQTLTEYVPDNAAAMNKAWQEAMAKVSKADPESSRLSLESLVYGPYVTGN